MKEQPLVSIITPTYNHEKFIGQCIESVLAQTYSHWEQIIIDDGSTDKTGEVVAQYKDERIRYIRQNNVGIWRLGETYNKALQISEGELIAVLEGDDFWPPYKLKRQLPAFEREEVVLSWGRGAIADSEGNITKVSREDLRWFRNRTRQEITRRLLFQSFIIACTVMCRKKALISIGGFKQPEYAPFVDWPTWLELSLIGNFQPIDEVMGYYRRHERQVNVAMIRSIIKANKYSVDFLQQLPQELKNSIGISSDDLLAQYRRDVPVWLLTSGRLALIKREWEEAKKSFKESFNLGAFSIKLKSLLGLVCAECKVDLEWAARIMGREVYRL